MGRYDRCGRAVEFGAMKGVVVLVAVWAWCCGARQQIVVAPGTSFREWDARLERPGHKFTCPRFEQLFECVVGDSAQYADVVVFQADELFRRKVPALPRKQPYQLYTTYSLESPLSYLPQMSKWSEYRDGNIDYVATVAPYPYETYPAMVPSTQKTLRLSYAHPSPDRFPKKSAQFVQKKTRLLRDTLTPWISVMINYPAEWRVQLLEETMAVFGSKIRSMGPVLNNYALPLQQGRFAHNWNAEKQKVIGEYLFHFAWENSWVPGFVTEKIFDCFVAGTVPIYVGTEDIYEFAPCDMSVHPCFIDYSHFHRNPVLLYNHVKYLVEHPAEYLRYFEWLDHPISPKYERLYRTYIENDGFCRMCEAYHKDFVKT